MIRYYLLITWKFLPFSLQKFEFIICSEYQLPKQSQNEAAL